MLALRFNERAVGIDRLLEDRLSLAERLVHPSARSGSSPATKAFDGLRLRADKEGMRFECASGVRSSAAWIPR